MSGCQLAPTYALNKLAVTTPHRAAVCTAGVCAAAVCAASVCTAPVCTAAVCTAAVGLRQLSCCDL